MPLSIIGKDIPSNIKGKFSYQSSNSVLRNDSAIREMRQLVAPGLSYEFIYPPTSFTHTGYGSTLNEINRPYSLPIIDITAGKAERCSFEFLMAPPKRKNVITDTAGNKTTSIYQDFFESVDDQIKFIQTMADYAIPIEFVNVHPALSIPKWHIDDITITHGRQNTKSATTSATCSLSLIQFIPRSKTMILLPRFQYGKFKPKDKIKPPVTPSGKEQVENLLNAIFAAKATGDVEAIRMLTIELSRVKKKFGV